MMEVTIQSVSPITEYNNTVYEHQAVVKTNNGQVFGIFDPDMLLSTDDIGSELQLEITLLTPKGESLVATGEERGVYPNGNNPEGSSDHRFCGYVTSDASFPGDRSGIVLDTGSGEVYVPGVKPDTPSDDPCVCVRALQAQLSGVNRG